jgi:hypothetical protein
MDIHNIFQLQDRAVAGNVDRYPDEFGWCWRAVELALDSHVFLANDGSVVSYRAHLRDSDDKAFVQMNVVVNLAYDATGSLISALRLLQYGVLADTWSLIRSAFESTCYAEFFSHNQGSVADYVQIAEEINRDNSVNVGPSMKTAKLRMADVRTWLENNDKRNRKSFYSRLSNFGTHASPVRSGFRMLPEEHEVRAYLSIGHRHLIQCIHDLAAVAKYAMGIPFETWPQLMDKQPPLTIRYYALEAEYPYIFAVGQ